MNPPITLLLSALLCAASISTTSCSSTSREYRRRAAGMQKRVEEFHSALQQAVAARVDVSKINMETGDVRERSLTLPPSEFATLKDILSRTKLIPVSAEPPTMATIIADDFYLVLLDAKGQALETHHIYFTWTSESNIKPRSPHTIFDPHWYLPDADYRRLLQLPTIRAAEKE